MHYFDNAATTYPKPENVYRYMDYFYRNYGVNVGRGQFKEASIAFAMVKETRELLLELFHASYPYEVIFTPSATIALNTIINSIEFKENDAIYITPFEHNAVIRTLYARQKEVGFKVVELIVEKTLDFDINKIAAQFKQVPPTYCFLTHASNSFGNIIPIEDICLQSKKYNAINIIDMAQTAGLIDTDIKKLNANYVVFAGHKTLYAPFGVAGIVTDASKKLKPFIFGGTGLDSINPEMPDSSPIRFEAGSLNILAIAGLNASLKWIFEIGLDNIRLKEQELTKCLLKVITKYKNISLIRGRDESKNIGIVSCLFEGYSSDSIGQVLSENDIAVRTGLHCAPLGHKLLKTSPAGTVRFSLSYFNKEEDFLALDKALNYIYLEG